MPLPHQRGRWVPASVGLALIASRLRLASLLPASQDSASRAASSGQPYSLPLPFGLMARQQTVNLPLLRTKQAHGSLSLSHAFAQTYYLAHPKQLSGETENPLISAYQQVRIQKSRNKLASDSGTASYFISLPPCAVVETMAAAFSFLERRLAISSSLCHLLPFIIYLAG